jgi:ribosome-associated toxin RatA of RatAB toxin-antitoxin module
MGDFGGDGTIEVEASRERCFEVAASAEGYPAWHPVIKSMTVLERDADGRPERATAVVDASVSEVTLEVSFSMREPDFVECRRESGDLKEMWTRFEFAEVAPGRTRVDYSTGLDPGRMLSMLARGAVLDRVRHKLIDEALAGFKAAAEAR